MHVFVCPDAGQVGARAAALVARMLATKPDSVLGLAAGATPVPLYRELVRRHRDEGLDFSQATIFGLDEYMGLADGHPSSCRTTFFGELIDKVNLKPSRIHLLDSRPGGDLGSYCSLYEREIMTAGGLDVQILGIGVNGHIGFNEPGAGLGTRTRVVRISAATRNTNKDLFGGLEHVPETALTMGVGTILSARRILLVATGAAKAKAVKAALEGPVTSQLPASALQLHHNAVFVLDEAAAAQLELRNHYDEEAASLDALGIDRFAAHWSVPPSFGCH